MPKSTRRRAARAPGLSAADWRALRRAARDHCLDTGAIITVDRADCLMCVTSQRRARVARLNLTRTDGLTVDDQRMISLEPSAILGAIIDRCGTVQGREYGPWSIACFDGTKKRIYPTKDAPGFCYRDAKLLVDVMDRNFRHAYGFTADGQRFTAAFDPFLRDHHGNATASPQPQSNFDSLVMSRAN